MKRNTKTRWTLGAIGALLIGTLTAGSPAFAQPPGRGDGELRHRGGERFDARLIEFLELTEEQQAEWTAIHEANREALGALMEQVRENRTALDAAIEAEEPLTIGELTLEGRRLREQMQAAQEDLRAQLSAILDTDQLERWEAFRAAREERPGFGRRGPRGPRRGPGGDA